jgi:hypothetical protein
MESIINIEDRLRVIKAIFEISIDAKVFPDDIYVYTINQKWDTTSNFRSESLSLSLNDPRHKKTIDIIYGLSCEIIALFDLLKMFIGELDAEYKYKIDCKPRGGGLDQLYLVRWRWESESQDKVQFIDGDWWPYKGIINEENSKFIFTSPLFIMFFVLQINQFLRDRIIDNPKLSLSSANSDYTVKSIIMAYCYMHKRNICPIPELARNPTNISLVHRRLSDIYGNAYDSFRNDWKLFKYKELRTTKFMCENIKGAIKLMQTIDHPNIKDAIDLAKQELKEAELNK